jgi:hypothetical protein
LLQPYSPRAFPRFQELGMKHHGFKNLSMTKQNKKKQSTLDIEDYLLLFLKNWQPETLFFSTNLKLFLVNWQKDHCMEP